MFKRLSFQLIDPLQDVHYKVELWMDLKSKLQFRFNGSNFNIIKQLIDFPVVIQESAGSYSPAIIANYTYDLVKDFNNYYQSTSILTAESEELINFRLGLSIKVGEVIKTAMFLLGVAVPDRMQFLKHEKPPDYLNVSINFVCARWCFQILCFFQK